MTKKHLRLAMLWALWAFNALMMKGEGWVRINQLGYLPQATKVAYIDGQLVECGDTRLMAVAHIVVEPFHGRCRHGDAAFLQGQRKLLKVGRRAQLLAVPFFYKPFQLFYFWCGHIFHLIEE